MRMRYLVYSIYGKGRHCTMLILTIMMLFSINYLLLTESQSTNKKYDVKHEVMMTLDDDVKYEVMMSNSWLAYL